MSKEAALRLFKDGSNDYRKIYRLFNKVSKESMKGYHIHHKDHNHKNNNPENLQMLTPEEHAKKHGFISAFVMSQAKACELAAHPLVRERARRFGKDNYFYGKKFSDHFKTKDDFENFCIKHRRGKNNSQYGNKGRITGDKNPMRRLSKGDMEAFKRNARNRVMTEEHLKSISIANKSPARCKKISDKLKGNNHNNMWIDKIKNMSDIEADEYKNSGIAEYRKTWIDNIRNPKPIIKREKKIPLCMDKGSVDSRLKVRLKALSDDEFYKRIDGKGKKYIRRLKILRNS